MQNFPIDVEEAISIVLKVTQPLGKELLSLTENLSGRVVAEDVKSMEDFPSFEASIMDGYAVIAPTNPGVFQVKEHVHAGRKDDLSLTSADDIMYITTGARLPLGANAVVKVEDTEKVDENKVRIQVSSTVGQHVRLIGSDIKNGELLIEKNQIIGPSEIGLLATSGRNEISCYRRPSIGVLSTGDEIVDPWETPTGSQVRDCNRFSLMAAFREDGYTTKDLGIIRDVKETLREALVKAIEECDIVVSSGGVSMGAADFVKPLLNEIGTVHFSKLNMKPGKPTTFASFYSQNKQTLFFGLPGNPCSCLVTKALFIDPALKRMQGFDSSRCLHPQLPVRLTGGNITLDPERPEYHRAIISNEPASQGALPGALGDGSVLFATSTGSQRSSRLLSMRAANGLLFLPRGPGVVMEGTLLKALVLRPLFPPAAPTATNPTLSVHPSAAGVDFDFIEVLKEKKNFIPSSTGKVGTTVLTVRTGLITISDRASAGVYEDKSGPEMGRLLQEMSKKPDFPLTFDIVNSAVIPDDPEKIRALIETWSDPENATRVDFLLTSGGTGFGARDLTPEAVRSLLHREAPGVAQALLNEGLKHTPLAVLSRPVVGTRNDTFICTLPGSVKAIKENIVCLQVVLPRIFELIKSGHCSG